jgi:signal transduction histidine kinase
MGKLISELLFLAQIDARQAVLARTVFDFSALLDEIREKMEPVAESRELGFSCHFEPGMTLRGDYDRIRQLLLILLDNAFKYTPARGMVRLSARKSRGKLEVMVEDSGIGICPEEKDRIFDRFYRVDKVRSRSQGGTGLGLSIARWIADAHHGTILVESEPGHGSRFIINLPLSRKNNLLYNVFSFHTRRFVYEQQSKKSAQRSRVFLTNSV